MIGDLYVQSVIDHMPAGLALRDQVAMELRSHIAERLADGQALDDVLRQLGDPLTLAESYLAAVPLESARIAGRLVAKLIDAVIVGAVVTAIAGALWMLLPPAGRFIIPLTCILGGVLSFVASTVTPEYRSGRALASASWASAWSGNPVRASASANPRCDSCPSSASSFSSTPCSRSLPSAGSAPSSC